MINLSKRFLVFVVASTFLSSSAFAAKGVVRVIETGSTQIEALVFGDGPVSLVIAAGNGRPASQLDSLVEFVNRTETGATG